MADPQDSPQLRLQYYRETGQTDLAEKYAQYLKETGQLPDAATAQPHKPLNPLELARLRRSMALRNRMDKENVDEGEPTYTDRLGIMAQRGASAMGPLGRTIPTAVRYATKRVIGEPETWQQSAEANAADVEQGGQEAPGINVPVLGRMTLADVPAGAFAFGKYAQALKGLSVPMLGATFAGGSRLTNPEEESALSRAAGTAGHAAMGAIIPKIIGGGLQAGRMGSALFRSRAAQTLDRNVVGRDMDMNAVGGPLYEMFRKLGNLPNTPALQRLVGSDMAQEVLARIRKADPEGLGKLPDNNAEILHALYREIGNKAFNAQNGVDPTPLRNGLAQALDEAAQQLGGSYAEPLAVWRRGNQGIDAAIRGSATLRNATRPTGTAPTKILDASPAAFERDYTGQNPNGSNPLGIERTAAAEGILGELKLQPKVRWRGVLPTPSDALRSAPDLLNFAEGGKQSGIGRVASVLQGSPLSPLGSGVSSSSVPTGTGPLQNAATPPNNYPQPLAGILRNPVRGQPMPSHGAQPLLGGSSVRALLPSATPSTISEQMFNSGPIPMGSGTTPPLQIPASTSPSTLGAVPPWEPGVQAGQARALLQSGNTTGVRGPAIPMGGASEVPQRIQADRYAELLKAFLGFYR